MQGGQTIKKSCENLLEEETEDRDDLQALLYVDKKFAKFDSEKGAEDLVEHAEDGEPMQEERHLLNRKIREEDEEFIAVSEKDMEMEKPRQMQGMPGMEGQGLSMFNREDMDSMMDGYGGYGDDEYGDLRRWYGRFGRFGRRWRGRVDMEL